MFSIVVAKWKPRNWLDNLELKQTLVAKKNGGIVSDNPETGGIPKYGLDVEIIETSCWMDDWIWTYSEC